MAKVNKTTISAVLAKKKMAASAKVAAISGIVTSVRAKYGNSDVEIKPTKTVNTCYGLMSMKYLSDEDKLALVTKAISSIRVQAIQTTESTTGIVFEREVEKLVATNPVLSNLEASVQSEII